MGSFAVDMTALKNGDFKAFETIFRSFSEGLERFAYEYVSSWEEAGDIVQNVFMTLWERRETLADDTRIFNYLFTLTKNQCLNYLKHTNAQRNYRVQKELSSNELLLNYYALDRFDENKLIYEELSVTIEKAIDSLPGQCREVFILSRMEGMTYQEIANKLNISIKTVEKKNEHFSQNHAHSLKRLLYPFSFLLVTLVSLFPLLLMPFNQQYKIYLKKSFKKC